MAGKQKNRRGQATVEFLPSIVVFLLVISAALSYFRALRSATLRQEEVRNIAFAKIGNSGTMTTPPNQMNGTTPLPLVLLALAETGTVPGPEPVNVSDNTFIDERTGCFAVSPGGSTGNDVAHTSNITAYMAGKLNPVQVYTYAVVYREASGQCKP